MFINISTNWFFGSNWNDYIYIHQNEIFDEQNFSKILNFINHNKIEKNIYILSWPWSFTNIRIWTIILNTIKTTKSSDMNFYFADKICIFQKIINNSSQINTIMAWIWQKSNYFEVSKNNFEKIHIENLSDKKVIWESLDLSEKWILIKYIDESFIRFEIDWKKFDIPNNSQIWQNKNLIEAQYMM